MLFIEELIEYINYKYYTCQLSQNIQDSPEYAAPVLCPERKLLFTLNVPEDEFVT